MYEHLTKSQKRKIEDRKMKIDTYLQEMKNEYFYFEDIYIQPIYAIKVG